MQLAMDGFASDGPGGHVKVFFPDPATGELHAPQLTATGAERPEGVELVRRDYTPPVNDDGDLELDLFLHGDRRTRRRLLRRLWHERLALAGPAASGRDYVKDPSGDT